jgi:hypothetical protein
MQEPIQHLLHIAELNSIEMRKQFGSTARCETAYAGARLQCIQGNQLHMVIQK